MQKIYINFDTLTMCYYRQEDELLMLGYDNNVNYHKIVGPETKEIIDHIIMYYEDLPEELNYFTQKCVGIRGNPDLVTEYIMCHPNVVAFAQAQEGVLYLWFNSGPEELLIPSSHAIKFYERFMEFIQ